MVTLIKTSVLALGYYLIASAGVALAYPTYMQYDVQKCGASIDSCSEISPGLHGGAPPAGYLDGFGQAAFAEFYERIIHGDTGHFSPLTRGATSGGYVFGRVSGPVGITAPFIFHGGEVICCFADEPVNIVDMNEFGLFVGNLQGFGWGYLGAVDKPLIDIPSQIPLFFVGDVPNSFFLATFIGIDNDSTILARFGSDYYQLVAVSEPITLAVFGIALTALGWCRRRLNPKSPSA